MVRKDNYALLYRIANYYYNDGMTQDEIARIENFSRPHVSRLLDRAKEVGIVKVEVVMPDILSTESIAEELRTVLGLKDVSVCPDSASSNNEISFEIAQYATNVLDKYLEDAKYIGLGWGYTLYQTARMINHKIKKKGLTFMPLVGLSNLNSRYYMTNNIVNLFAENTDSNGYYSSVPLVQNRKKLTELEEKSFNELKKQWKNIDAAIIGVGGPPTENELRNDPMYNEFKSYISTVDIAGNVITHYFDAKGNILDSDISKYFYTATYDINRLKELKTSICIAGGPDKADAITMFAKMGFFNKLITDETTARSILSKLEQETV